MNSELISIALKQYGIKEAAGDQDNPVILKMAQECGFDNYVHDAIPWCSMFLNWVCLKAAYQRSKSLMARSWLNVGVATDDPDIGDVVVISRGDPNGVEGHVGLYINMDDKYVYLLAGNQNDMVNIVSFDKARVLGFRRLGVVI